MCQIDLSKFFGCTSAEVFTALVTSNKDITKVLVHKFTQPPLLQKRITFSEIENSVFVRAMGLHEDLGLPFWDALLMSCMKAPTVPYRLLNEATYHQDNSSSIMVIPRKDVLAQVLIEMSNTPSLPRVAMLSKLILKDGSHSHIPMLDFHCHKSNKNLTIVCAVSKQLFKKGGFVLESGESYHGIGVGILAPDTFLDFLATSLLFCPIVDRVYIAHQLLHRTCSLRISTGGRAQKTPRVVAVV